MKTRLLALLLSGCLLLTACSASARGEAQEDEDLRQIDAAQTSDAPPPQDQEGDVLVEPAPDAGEEGMVLVGPAPDAGEEDTVPAEPELTLEDIRTIRFRDVPEDAAYADCARYVSYLGYLGGVGEELFGPEELASRAMVFTALQRISGQEAPAYTGGFSDVDAGDWYAGPAAWAVQAGLVDTGGNMGPEEPVRRSELAVLLYRFASYEDGKSYDSQLSAFADGSAVPENARQAMAWAIENRLFSDIIYGTIYPNLPVSRAQLAQVLTALSAYQGADLVSEALTVQLSAKIAVNTSRENHEDIQLLIDSTASKHGAIGLQVAVVENGRVTDYYSYGWAQKGSTAMTADHKIRVASISKVMVGVSAMLLREEGVISLDDDIGPYWGIKARNPYYPKVPITIRSLMTHTSSIKAFEGTSRTQSAVKSQLSQSSGYSHVKPGAITSWNYNNYAFGVLGMTLEIASGRYLDSILGERLWSAMDIDAAFEAGCIEATDLLATLYYHGGGVGRSVASQKETKRPDSPGGTGAYFAGGLTVSAKDLAKMDALLAGDGCFEGVRLMEAESVALMETRDEHILGDGTYQALPLRSQDAIYGRDRLYYHTGSAYGVYNLMSYDPATGDGVVVLSVGASGAKDSRGIYAVCGDIANYIYEIMK